MYDPGNGSFYGTVQLEENEGLDIARTAAMHYEPRTNDHYDFGIKNYDWSHLLSKLILRNYGREDLREADIARDLDMEHDFSAAIWFDELKVLMQRYFLHRSEHVLPPEELLQAPHCSGGVVLRPKQLARQGPQQLRHGVLVDLDLRAEARDGLHPPQRTEVDQLLLRRTYSQKRGGVRRHRDLKQRRAPEDVGIRPQDEESCGHHPRLKCWYPVVLDGLQRQLRVVGPTHVPLRSDGYRPDSLLQGGGVGAVRLPLRGHVPGQDVLQRAPATYRAAVPYPPRSRLEEYVQADGFCVNYARTSSLTPPSIGSAPGSRATSFKRYLA